jgi:hypothetical protein
MRTWPERSAFDFSVTGTLLRDLRSTQALLLSALIRTRATTRPNLRDYVDELVFPNSLSLPDESGSPRLNHRREAVRRRHKTQNLSPDREGRPHFPGR